MKLARLLAATPIVAVLSFWVVQGILLEPKPDEAARIIAEIQPLLPDGPVPPEKREPFALRGKVFFWDMPAKAVRHWAQAVLPEHLRGKPGDEALTVVLIGDVREEEVRQYSNGRAGYRQVATVYVVHWPEARVLGSATVTSDDPPEKLPGDGKLGFHADLDMPLVKWVQTIPLESSPEYQTLLAQHRAVQGALPLLKDDAPIGNAKPMTVRGKALVWDLRTNTRATAHNHLPPELRANGADGPLTVFAITEVRSEELPNVNPRLVSFRDHVTLSVVRLPDKERLGTVTVSGDMPPLAGSHGPIDKPIADWIARLPRE